MRSQFRGSAPVSNSYAAERATSGKARTKTVLAGHNNISTTQRYIKLNDHALREPVARVGSPHQLHIWLLGRGQRRSLAEGVGRSVFKIADAFVCASP